MTRTITLTAGTGDCFTNPGGGAFDATSVTLDMQSNYRWWIPFVVPLPRAETIISATLTVVGAVTSGASTTHANFGCEAADNPSTPVSGADLNGRTFTTWVNNLTITQYINGTSYGYDVTGAVQEIVNRSGWTLNNTMATMLRETDAAGVNRFAHSSNAASNKPTLTIVVYDYLPLSGGLI